MDRNKKPERRNARREYDRKRQASKPWRALYQAKEWKALRAAQLRKQPLCERCLEQKPPRYTPANIIHHVVKHEGDPTLFFNGELRSSCAPCHDAIEQGIEARGYDHTIGPDGVPTDPNHPFNR